MAKFRYTLPTAASVRHNCNGEIMLSIINNDYDEKYMLVKGVMGCGLDIIAFFRMIRLVNSGKKVLFLSHFKMITINLLYLLSEHGISANCIDLIQNWQNIANSDVLPSVLHTHFKDYELILFEPNLKESEIHFLGNTFGKIHFFLSLNMLPVNSTLSDEKSIEHSYNKFILQVPFDKTYQIYNFARHFIPDNLTANDTQILSALKRFNFNGDLPEVLKFKSSLDLLKRVCNIAIDYRKFNILVVLPEYTNSLVIKNTFLGYKCEATILDNETDLTDLKNIIITSLEYTDWLPPFDIVIFVDFQAVDDNKSNRWLLYQKLILSKTRVIISFIGDFPKMLNNFPSDTYDTGTLF